VTTVALPLAAMERTKMVDVAVLAWPVTDGWGT
jgi:hypothetical protein